MDTTQEKLTTLKKKNEISLKAAAKHAAKHREGGRPRRERLDVLRSGSHKPIVSSSALYELRHGQ